MTFRTPYDADEVVRGDVLRRPAVRRLDRPHRPARRRPRRRCCAASRPRCCRWPTTSSCCPATASRPRSAASAPTNPFLPGPAPSLGARPRRDLSKTHPAERVPRVAARSSASSSSRSIDQPARDLRAARLRQHRDPRGRAARPAAAQGRDRQGGLRPAPAAGRPTTARRLRSRPALRPDRAVRALRARERRQAGVPVPALPDPEGLARRAPAGGPLPRVHPGRHRRRRAATSCRSTTTSRWRG